MFAVCFIGRSYPIPAASFARVDDTHYVLDVVCSVSPQYWELKEAALFLVAPGVLPDNAALGLYVKAGSDGAWLYRGCVHAGHPSEVMPLQWPAPESGGLPPPQPGCIQVGVSVEPLGELAAKEGSRLGDKMDFGRRVGLDLFRFLESFATQAGGDAIVIPSNALDRWLTRFTHKFRVDPDFLTRSDQPM